MSTGTHKTLTLAAILILGASLSHAQQDLAGRGRYAQFRNMSGLSGGSFGVRPDGTPSIDGALSLSTPIAYSLSGGHAAFAIGNNSYDRRFRTFAGVHKEDFGTKSNGTAAGMAGLSTRFGDFTVGMSVVSGAFENFYSLQYTPVQSGRVRFAVGAQGLFAAGGFLGPGLHSDADRPTSLFAVGTAQLEHGIFVSAGLGTSRFSRGFGNVSFPLGRQIRGLIEHDGFGWNYGASFELARYRSVKLNAFAGMVQNRYAFWSVGFAF